MISVVKKDGTKEDFNVQKVVVAVNKSAYRALVTFTDEELDFICRFVEDRVKKMNVSEIRIAQMHNVVESALEAVNPAVAKLEGYDILIDITEEDYTYKLTFSNGDYGLKTLLSRSTRDRGYVVTVE